MRDGWAPGLRGGAIRVEGGRNQDGSDVGPDGKIVGEFDVGLEAIGGRLCAEGQSEKGVEGSVHLDGLDTGLREDFRVCGVWITREIEFQEVENAVGIVIVAGAP